jgi:hypothetical protein
LADVIFHEDDFDSVTKIRRGRVFTTRHQSQPQKWHVHDPNQPHLQSENWGHGISQLVSVVTYQRDTLSDQKLTSIASLPTVVLGWEPHLTFWKIVSVENNLVGTPVLTLKAHHSLGDTPKLNLEDIPKGIGAIVLLIALAIGGIKGFVPVLITILFGAAILTVIGGLGFIVCKFYRFKNIRLSPSPDISEPVGSTSENVPRLTWSVDKIEDSLGEIDWYQFEKFCAALLRSEGFSVERKGGAQPDGGVDLIATKNGEPTTA